MAENRTDNDMRAVRIHRYGDASELRCERTPRPELRPDDLLVRVHGAGINPADWQFRRGDFAAYAPLQFPATLGWDVSGVVERVGPKTRGFSVGDAVFAMCDMSRPGAYAELVAVQDLHVAPAPHTLPLVDAAAVPLAALTAWHALFELADLRAGQTVLVHAGAGGVGQFAVQMAHLAGARVLASASRSNHALLGALGADECVDYRDADWSSALRHRCDVVLDGAGGDTRRASWPVLRPGGLMVAIAMPPIDPAEAASHGCRAALAHVKPDGQRLREIASRIDTGELRVSIDFRFPLDRAADAHVRSESRHARGKVLLTVTARDD